jgi:Uma2 family endonuclease
MIAAKENFPRFTPEEYFAWEEQQEEKHEYFDGEVYAMSGGTLNHSRIAVNVITMLDNHLSDGGCQVLNSGARIKIHRSEKYVYPDVSVTCDERDRDTTQYITHPCTIVEVLSPSTEAYDRGKKFKLYRQSSSLIEYVLVNADEIEIDVFRKNDRGRWEEISYVVGDRVELESISLTFPIDRVYRGIKFDAESIDKIKSPSSAKTST